MNENLLKLLECFHKHLDHYMEIEDRVEMLDLLDNVRADMSNAPVESERAEPTATEPEHRSGWCCEQTHPDGRRCINPVATGKSYCWGKYHKYSVIPTATEPEVPEEGQCICLDDTKSRRCLKRRRRGSAGTFTMFCEGPCNFGPAPDVPSEDTQCKMTRDGIQCCNRANGKAVFQFCKGDCDFGPVPDMPPDHERCIQVEDSRRCRNEATDGHKVFCECGHNFIGDAPDVPSEGGHRHCNTCGMRSHGTNAELRAKLKDAMEFLTPMQQAQLDTGTGVRYKKAGDA